MSFTLLVTRDITINTIFNLFLSTICLFYEILPIRLWFNEFLSLSYINKSHLFKDRQ